MELIELRVHLQPHDTETSGAYPMAIDKAAKNLKIYKSLLKMFFFNYKDKTVIIYGMLTFLMFQ
jgi:hypothetical protein